MQLVLSKPFAKKPWML